MIRLVQLTLLVFVLLLAGCVSTPGLLTKSVQPFNSSQWQEYDAVYEYDELRIKESFDDDYGFDTYYTYNQKLHILTRKGVEYGTLVIPRVSDKITEFEVVLLHANREVVEIDLIELRKKYIDTGKIVVPQVQPGSTISITVTFKKPDPLIRFEYSLIAISLSY